MKRSVARSRAWLRLGGFFSLVAVLLTFAMSPASAVNQPAARATAVVAEDDLVTGDDVLRSLAFEGVEPTDAIPTELQPTSEAPQPAKKGSGMPARVDNSKSKYFPPIMQQKGGSCAQASGIYYNFTYELNLSRGLDSNLVENQYPTHWTWNCLNNAAGKGSNYTSGWNILKEVGVPSIDVYGERFALHANGGWPTGYEKYYAAMRNRVDSYGSMPIRTPADLEKVKGYLINHNDPASKVGGLLSFSMNFKNRKSVKLPKGAYEEGRTLVTAWGDGGGHAMTYVGYDDNIVFDVNKDGKITNDVDLNGDGKIDMADWERGAFIFANSHGTKFGDQGFGYAQYRLSVLPKAKGGQWPNVAWVKPKTEYQPRTTMMLRFNFSDRGNLKLAAGFAASASATQPTKTVAPGIYNGKAKVGNVPMRGKDSKEPIEIGLDLTNIVANAADGKFFINLGRKDSKATGELLAACIYRYDDRGRVISVHNFAIRDGKFGDSALDLSMVTKR